MENNFFCFDSDSLEDVTTKLYGYGISQEGIILNDDDACEKLTPLGAYVYVDARGDAISISQDYIGSFGLYYYHEKDYFAISNSFLRLMEHLRDNHKNITFNKPYADYYMGCSLSANLSSETLVNEIEMLSKDLMISIDKKTKEIEFEHLNLNESSVPINSTEALDILDGWFYRWIEIIRSIRKSSNDIVIDLSGGFDSRLTSVIWLNANIDLTKIKINSGKGPGYEEDYQIASKIADEFGFKLNKRMHYETISITPKESIANSEYVKFGFEKQRFINDFKCANPFYRISGHCGEILREYINKTPEDYVRFIARRSEILNPLLKSSCEDLLNREFDMISQKYDLTDKNSKELSEIMYKYGRCRNHFGKEFVDSFLFNRFTITPLGDPDLQKIKFKVGIDDDKLLIALIFKRYCPKLLDFEFCDNAQISPETLRVCDEINALKQFKPREYEFVEGPSECSDSVPKYTNNKFDEIANVFNCLEFKKEFEKYYPEDLYNSIRLGRVKNRNNVRDIYSAIEVVKTINDVKAANSNNNQDFTDWIETFPKNEVEANEIEASVRSDIYSTSRIDIKNNGRSENALEIIENSDESSSVAFPKWFSGDDGKGCVISSKKLKLDLTIRAINDGELVFKLKGPYVTDKNRKMFPVYIEYAKFTVDGRDVLNERVLVTHDDNYSFKMPVNDSQLIDVHVEWMPFGKSSEYLNKKIELLEAKIKRQEAKINELENKSSGKFSKLISKL